VISDFKVKTLYPEKQRNLAWEADSATIPSFVADQNA